VTETLLTDIALTTLDGRPTTLAELADGAALVVNVASKCGLTPQYTALEQLAKDYGERGLTVIGVPCNQFMGQEPGTAEEIRTFCSSTYGVTFPLTERTSVRADPSPLWRDLARQPKSGPPAWNFAKYLVGADGRLIGRWPTKVTPEDPQIVEAIEAALPA